MHRGRLSGQYGRLSSFTTCWWAGEECRVSVMYGMRWWSTERGATSFCSRLLLRRFPAASHTAHTHSHGWLFVLCDCCGQLLSPQTVSTHFFKLVFWKQPGIHFHYIFILICVLRISLLHCIYEQTGSNKSVPASVFMHSLSFSELYRWFMLLVTESTFYRLILACNC